MNREELRNEVLGHGFSVSNYATRVNSWIDDGQAEIFRRTDMRVNRTYFEFNTAINTIYYALPSDFGHISSLVLFDDEVHNRGYNLGPLAAEDFDNIVYETGQPIYYTIDGQTIGLHPTPDNISYTLSLVYYKVATSLVDDSASPVIPIDYHNLIVEYVLIQAYAAEHDWEASKFHQDQYEVGLGRMISRLQSDAYDPPYQIGDDNLVEADNLWWD